MYYNGVLGPLGRKPPKTCILYTGGDIISEIKVIHLHVQEKNHKFKRKKIFSEIIKSQIYKYKLGKNCVFRKAVSYNTMLCNIQDSR